MKNKQRKHSPEFKAKLAVEALKGEKTLAEIGSEDQLHPRQIQEWRKQLIDNAGAAFASGTDKETKEWQAEKAQLYARIGKLTVERDFLHKGLNL